MTTATSTPEFCASNWPVRLLVHYYKLLDKIIYPHQWQQ